MWRLRPTCLPEMPLRSSSSGVPIAPPATTTARPRTSNSVPIPSAAGPEPSGVAGRATTQRTPVTRPSSRWSRRASTPARTPRPGGDRAGHVGDVHRALRVEAAAERAGAAADAAARVARDRAAAGADRGGALHHELAVAPHPLDVDGRDLEHLLGLGVLGVEARRPVDAVLRGPAREDVLGRAEAGARVDHRGAADRSADRHRDHRPALGDGQPVVAVEALDRGQRVVGVAHPVEVGPGLEHDHVEPGLGEHRGGDRAAGARPDHDRRRPPRPRAAAGRHPRRGSRGTSAPSATSQPIS